MRCLNSNEQCENEEPIFNEGEKQMLELVQKLTSQIQQKDRQIQLL